MQETSQVPHSYEFMMTKKKIKSNRRTTTKAPDLSFTNTINDHTWRCAVSLAVERTTADSHFLQCFREGAATNSRPQVTSIHPEDVLDAVKAYTMTDIPSRLAFIKSFPHIFQPAVGLLKQNPHVELPLSILVNIVKVLILMIRQRDLVTLDESDLETDPVLEMAERPSECPGGGISAAKSRGKKKSMNTQHIKRVKLLGHEKRAPEGASDIHKKNTLLFRRGQVPPKDAILDAPKNAYFQHYIVLSGLYQPDLPLALLAANIPLLAVFCIDTSPEDTSDEPNITYISSFWDDFREIFWKKEHITALQDVIFQVNNIDTSISFSNLSEMIDFAYREISYLMYDLSKLKRQHQNYLQNMKVWNVEESGGRVELFGRFTKEVDALQREDVTVPLIVKCMLDVLCTRTENYISPEVHEERAAGSSDKLTKPVDSSEYLPNYAQLQLRHTFHALDQSFGMDDKEDKDFELPLTLEDDVGSEPTCVISTPPGDFVDLYENVLMAALWRKFPMVSSRIRKSCLPINIQEYRLYLQWISRASSAEARKEISICHEEDITNGSVNFSPQEDGLLNSRPRRKTSLGHGFGKENIHYEESFKRSMKIGSSCQVTVEPELQLYEINTPEHFTNEEENGSQHNCRTIEKIRMVEELDIEKMDHAINNSISKYECLDFKYSNSTDCLFLMFYNKSGPSAPQCKSSSVNLKTPVGFRDFFDHVIDQESTWLAVQEDLYEARNNRLVADPDMNLVLPNLDFQPVDFMLKTSIKYRAMAENMPAVSKEENIKSSKSKPNRSSLQKVKKLSPKNKKNLKDATNINAPETYLKPPSPINTLQGESYVFNGYNVSEEVVHFSGFRTLFEGAGKCNVCVELQDRLYGTQDLSLHVQQGGHSLRIYTCMSPKPDQPNPATLLVTYKSGLILTLTERNPPPGEFPYDVKMSLPSGLTIETRASTSDTCYVKQQYLTQVSNEETSRLFVENGDVVRILTGDRFEVLRANTCTLTSTLADLQPMPPDIETDNFDYRLENFTVVYSDGHCYEVEKESVVQSKIYQSFKNVDVEGQKIYNRRLDGTNYVLLPDGTLCAQFRDGTKISSQPYVSEEYEEEDGEISGAGEDDWNHDFLLVHNRFIMEHPKYATVEYDSGQRDWTIHIPGSSVTIQYKGDCFINFDHVTKLQLTEKLIHMFHVDEKSIVLSDTVVDLSAFENQSTEMYCITTDARGNTFLVDRNGKCYFESSEIDDGSINENTRLSSKILNPFSEKRYFVSRRDGTGFEVVEEEYVKQLIREDAKNARDVVLGGYLPGQNTLRYYVLLQPVPVSLATESPNGRWAVPQITPQANYDHRETQPPFRSTYGEPPSWIHPFPKKRPEVKVPEKLTSRIWLEMQETSISSCPHIKDIPVPPTENIIEKTEDYIKLIANNDLPVLQELYWRVMKPTRSCQNNRNDLKQTEGEDDFAFMTKSIAFCSIPNYFDHPVGICWSILKDLVNDCTFKVIVRSASVTSSISMGEYDNELSFGDSISCSDSLSKG